jgi:hypothetical protein
MATRCPVKGCPTTSGRCAFHGQEWPASFRATDRIIRQRPGQSVDPPNARSRPRQGGNRGAVITTRQAGWATCPV